MHVLQGWKIKEMELSEAVQLWFAGTLTNDVVITYADFKEFQNIVAEMVAKGGEMPCVDPNCDCHKVCARKSSTIVDGVEHEGLWYFDGTAWRESKLLAELAEW